MDPAIVLKKETNLVGYSKQMSFAENDTPALWELFMPRRQLIKNLTGQDLYSLQVYPAGFFDHFNPAAHFIKWAAMEVKDFDGVPPGMKPFVLPAGKYAVFYYKGASSEANKFFSHIFKSWLPSSPYELDERPHFEILGEKFDRTSAGSEEEIWIPVREKPGNAG